MISLISFVLLLKFVAPLVNGEAAIIGVAVLSPQAPFLAVGSLTFTQQNESLKVEGEIVNTFPNTHFRLHVHEQGDLTQGCKSVGSYFNPRRNQRGAQSKNEKFWTNFGTVMSNMFGHIRVSLTVSNGSLIGNEGIFGRSIVLHEGEDALGFDDDEKNENNENSGERVACGIIGIRQPTDLLPTQQNSECTKMNQHWVRD